MRTAVMIILGLLLLVTSAGSQIPNDNLVVPGVLVGKWTLKMTIDELEKMNGPAHLVNGPLNDDIRGPKTFVYFWESLDFAASGHEPRKVEWLNVAFMGSVPWRTAKGIGLQSIRADILKAYGSPTVETVPHYGQTNMIYDAIGVDFQVYNTGPIREIRVFRPGTAKSIWKC